MAFREVTMIEVKEVLRQWLAGVGKKTIAARVELDPKTVRRYVRAAESCGVIPGVTAAVTEEALAAIVAELSGAPPREHGDAWKQCVHQRPFIEQKRAAHVRLSKVRRLMLRHGVDVPYSTLHRFAAVELGFGRARVTMPIVDGEPGEELQVDTGWMTLLVPGENGKRRRFRAWIFTPYVSRYRFVWPCFQETTGSAIEACERAWEFYGGVFRVLALIRAKRATLLRSSLGNCDDYRKKLAAELAGSLRCSDRRALQHLATEELRDPSLSSDAVLSWLAGS